MTPEQIFERIQPSGGSQSGVVSDYEWQKLRDQNSVGGARFAARLGFSQFKSRPLGLCGHVFVLTLLSLNAAESPFHPSIRAAPSLEYAADRILIRPKSQASAVAVARFHEALHCRILRTFETVGPAQVVALPKGGSVAEYVAKYEQSGLVEFAEPDHLRHLDSVSPNDPKFVDGTLWALNNYGQNGGTLHADIDAPDAWGVLNSASNIVVGILDTGMRYTHEDLAANAWTNPRDGSHGTNAIAGTSDPSDDNGHGSLMAGVIGAVGNNGTGIVGVAWRVQLMACKCFDRSGVSSDSAIIGCIDYAQANGARIINASFDNPAFGQALSNAIFRASASGIIFVTSAGNDSANIDVTPRYPACYAIDNVLSLAYTTRNDALGSFSNFGATNVDLAAPGDQIFSTFYTSDSSYYPPTGLGINLAGTSFAAAYASGACALMLAKFPAEPYQLILSRIRNAVDPLPALKGKCATGGRLNLFKALSPPVILTPVASAGGLLTLRVSGGPNRTCVVEVSSNFTNWTAVLTKTTSLAGTFDFAQPMTAASQFFRAASAP